MRTQGHYDYEDRILAQLGLDENFYKKFVKPEVRRIKGNKCEQCGTEGDLDVHHSSYKEITIHTLKLLCHKCHIEAEKTVDKTPGPIPSMHHTAQLLINKRSGIGNYTNNTEGEKRG